MAERMFPLLDRNAPIPWRVAEIAYVGYVRRYGTAQSLETLARRGGFDQDEMDTFYPGWQFIGRESGGHYMKETERAISGPIVRNCGEAMSTQYEPGRELLRRVHDRLGGYGVDIRTFGKDHVVEIRWRRNYEDCGGSDERWVGDLRSLEDALQAVLDYEDGADAADAEKERDA